MQTLAIQFIEMHEDASDFYRSASGLQLWSIYRTIYMQTQVWTLLRLQFKKNLTTVFLFQLLQFD